MHLNERDSASKRKDQCIRTNTLLQYRKYYSAVSGIVFNMLTYNIMHQ
jgi:hypothetical protein